MKKNIAISISVLTILSCVLFGYQKELFFIKVAVAAKISGRSTVDFSFSSKSEFFELITQYENKERFSEYCDSTKEYRNIVNSILNKENIPQFLAAIPFVKTRYKNVTGIDNAGIWFFSPFTAQLYDLQIDGKLDDRMNVEKSTMAAAKYLKDVYEMLGDWNLTLLSYEVGEGSVLQFSKNLSTRDPYILEKHYKSKIVSQIIAAQLFQFEFPCP